MSTMWTLKKLCEKMGTSPRHAKRFISELGYQLDYAMADGRRSAVLHEDEARTVLEQWQSHRKARRSRESAMEELRRLRAELSAVRRERDTIQRELEAIQAASHQALPWSGPEQETQHDHGHAHHATMVLVLSDLHFGEVVNRRETYGANEYNVAIAERRVRNIGDHAILVARDYFSGSSKLVIDGVVLMLGGDLVSGTIHEELLATNEQTTMESIVHFVPLVAEDIIAKLHMEFGKVHVMSVPGNHDRAYKKVPAKHTATSSASWVFSKWLEDRFKGTPEITFDIAESADAYVEIYNTRLCLTHGDAFKTSDSVIGMLGPVKRGTLKKSFRDSQIGQPFDVLVCGHFHSYCSAPYQGFITNGSLKGVDEYSLRWGFAPEPPMQALFMVTPEYGITFQAPVFAEDN